MPKGFWKLFAGLVGAAVVVVAVGVGLTPAALLAGAAIGVDPLFALLAFFATYIALTSAICAYRVTAARAD